MQSTGLPADDPAQQELESIRAAIAHLPRRSEVAPECRRQRARESAVAKRRMAALLAASPEVRAAIEAQVAATNGEGAGGGGFDRLDALLRRQAYRLASWRVAAEEINYRRFFDVNELAAIRMEDPRVFDRAHRLLFELIDSGRVQGLRLDHTDGLFDPVGYFEALQRRFRPDPKSASRNPDDAARPLPVFVEKILGHGERLPGSWPVDGTTGYEFAAAAIGVLVDGGAEATLTRAHRHFTGDELSFREHVDRCKRRVVEESLSAEVNVLARRLERLASSHRAWRDFTLSSLTRALVETLVAFPVYRTYLRASDPPTEDDVRHVTTAIRAARRAAPSVDASVFTFLGDVLLLRADRREPDADSHLEIALRFQQLTGPVMAKSVEDTAFYRYNRLLALNEVGSDPGHFGTSVDEFHAANSERLRTWPLSMLATSTHDSKRGEDAQARLAVLSEMPTEWVRAVMRWTRRTEGHRSLVDGRDAPSRLDQYTFFQALVGAWPAGWDGGSGREEFLSRTAAFMEKAVREAKLETSWMRRNEWYEVAVRRYLERSLRDDGFVADVAAFCARLGPYGAANGLSLALLRVTSPGIPDTYQGAELWNQSYVDPDNRAPVDFERRRRMLVRLRARAGRDRAALARRLLGRWADGAVKLYVLQEALATRARHHDVFRRGDYQALPAGDHLVSFVRGDGDGRIVVVAPRLSYRLTRGERKWPVGRVWGERRLPLPPGCYRDAFTGTRHDVGEEAPLVAHVLADFPVALLVDESRARAASSAG